MEIKKMKCYCSECNKRTNHEIIAEANHSYSYEEDGIYGEETYRIVKCCGCDHISFNKENSGTEYFAIDEYGEYVDTPEYISYPIKENEIQAIYSWDIPDIVSVAYHESITAYNNDCYLLATIGLRTTVEAICKDKGISGKLKVKIDGLLAQGIITKNDCHRLHEMRLSGNHSVHEMEALNKQELLVLIEIVNNMLNNLYILDKKFKDTFFYRFESLSDFIALLDSGVEKYSKGSSYVLHALLPNENRYRKEDVIRYESELVRMINAGTYTKLALDGVPAGRQRQRFRVI